MDKVLKRFPRQSKNRDTRISSPVLLESSLDDGVLQRYPDVAVAQAMRRVEDESPSQTSQAPLFVSSTHVQMDSY
jgi:hypothetical protein